MSKSEAASQINQPNEAASQINQPNEEEPTTTGDLRRILLGGLKKASLGQMNYNDGKLLIGMTNQITHSLVSEIKQREQMIRLGATTDQLDKLGHVVLIRQTEPVPA